MQIYSLQHFTQIDCKRLNKELVMTEIAPSLTSEVMDVKSARFNDALEPEYEEAWKDFSNSLLEARAPVLGGDNKLVPLLVDLWRDQEAPQVYRDRAMLQLINRYYVLQDNLGVSTSAWGDGTVRLVELDDLDLARRDQWYKDLLTHTARTGEFILQPDNTYMLAIDLFNLGLIQRSEFEAVLDLMVRIYPDFKEEVAQDSFDGKETYTYKRSVLPEYARHDTDRYDRLHSWRFPVLDDVITGRFARGVVHEHSRAWAVEQFNSWLDYKLGIVDRSDLPSWLATLNDDEDNLTAEMFHSRSSGFHSFIHRGKPPLLSWDTYKKGVELIGWKTLSSSLAVPPEREGDPPRVRMHFRYVLWFVSKMEDTEFADELLEYYLQTFYAEIDSQIHQESRATDEGGETKLEEWLDGAKYDLDLIDEVLQRLESGSELAQNLTRMKTYLVQKRTREEKLREQERLERVARDEEYAAKRNARELKRAAAEQKLPELLARIHQAE